MRYQALALHLAPAPLARHASTHHRHGAASAAPRRLMVTPQLARPRRVAAAALDAASLASIADGAAAVAGAALDLLLGGVPAASAAEAGEAAAFTPFGLSTETLSLLATAAVATGVPLAFGAARDATVKSVSPADTAQLLAAGALLVDVRGEALTAHGGPSAPRVAAVPFARLVDGALTHNADFADDVAYAAGAAPIVLCDAAGAHAQQAGRELAAKTRNEVYVLEGGFQAWVAAQQPVVGDAAAALMPAALAADAAPVAGPGAGFALGAFRPKLLTVLAEGYGLAELRRDVLAGLSVGVIALSLSAALGIASESTPAAGLYTAVAAGFVVSALGGSRVAIGGPTAAFIPVLIAVEHQYGAEGLVTCTVMAGGMLVVMGLAGLGTFITKIPRPVITGFTAGIATFIFSTQLKDFLGLHLPAGAKVPPGFVEKLGYLAQHLDTAHAPSLALAVGCLALLKAYPAAWAKSVPPQIVAVVAGTLVVAALEAGGVHTGIDTIGTRFGVDAIPSGLPLPHLALPSVEVVEGLLSPAFTIALLAAIESLLCAVVADGMIDDKHDSNTELIAQGLANIASASIGGLPATGALARTAANIRSGGRSPVSGMVHALTVLAIMLVAAPAAAYIPLPALSAVLVLVALNMGEWKNFAALPGLPAGEAVVYLTAFMLTVLTDVTVAVEAGLALSALLYLKRITDATDAAPPHLALPAGAPLALPAPAVATLQLSGALLFGATDKLEAAVARAAGSAATRVLLLDCEHIIAVDATGLEALQEAQHKLHKAGKRLVLSGLRQQPLAALATAGLMASLGHANVVRSAEEGAARALALLEPAPPTSSNGNGTAVALAAK